MQRRGGGYVKTQNPREKKVEKTQSERPATKSTAVSEKREGGQIAN